MNRAPFCFPLKDDSAEFVGALVNLIKVEFFTGAVTDVKIGQTGYPYVVNAAGMIIIHSKKEFISIEDIGMIPEMADIFEAIGVNKKGR
jgi:methyl-accepting chemotaxis protein